MVDENIQRKNCKTAVLVFINVVFTDFHTDRLPTGWRTNMQKFKNMQSNSSTGQAANGMEDVVCAVTSSEAVFKLFNVESDAAVVVLKKFDDLRLVKKT